GRSACPSRRQNSRCSTREDAFVNNTCMADASSPLQTLERDLREIFGGRLQSLVHYGARAHKAASNHRQHHHGHHEPALVHTLVVVDTLTADDLKACARHITSWHDKELATPLM